MWILEGHCHIEWGALIGLTICSHGSIDLLGMVVGVGIVIGELKGFVCIVYILQSPGATKATSAFFGRCISGNL